MKYMVEYEVRMAGLTHEQNMANQEAILRAFSKWQGEEGLTVHAFLATMSTGGYVLVEADDPGAVTSFVSKFVFWNEVRVVPVVDVADAVGAASASLAWTRNALSG